MTTVAQQVKKQFAVYSTHKGTIVFTTYRHWSTALAKVHSMSSNFTYLRYVSSFYLGHTVVLHKLQSTINKTNYTGLFKMTVAVLTTCHTQ